MGARTPAQTRADASGVGTACVIFLYGHNTFNLLLFNYFVSFDRNGGDALFLWMSPFPDVDETDLRRGVVVSSL